jgi:UDP-2-acetamido-2-deoxy-ribo-hexuluronate aminotransferase
MTPSEPIQMVDLQTQYQSLRSEVDPAIAAILQATNFINGGPVKDFACNLAGYLGAREVIPCGNGTDALQIALMALDLKPGDEVITSPFTFIATAEVIALLGLKPVFADVDPDTFLIDPTEVEKRISPRTRVILPVHLYGQCADMAPLLDLAARHHLYVIEDNAQAIGAQYLFPDGRKAMAGTIGTIGCTSFYPSKNLGAYGDGGAIMTQDEKLGDHLRMICNHGSKVRYYHDVVGVNSRLDTIQAAILDIKLRHLDDYNRRRREAADRYDAGLAGIPEVATPLRAPWSSHVFHQYTLRVTRDRDALKDYLQQAGIPTMIYYPVPLHLQPAYRDAGYREGDMPVSERLMHEVISLPMHPELSREQTDYIVHHIRSFFKA